MQRSHRCPDTFAAAEPDPHGHRRFPAAGLAQIGRYVSMLLQWRGELFTVSITAQDFEFPVTLFRSRHERAAAIVLVTKQPQREKAIRLFFEQQSIAAVLDRPLSD